MQTGRIFDIKEFAVQDGPGIRTTVFLKGCPLRCIWCHNPEGLSSEPEVLRSRAGERHVGQEASSKELADLLNRQAEILRSGEGGVTFSGGEPLMQSRFLAEVISQLEDIHVLLDTCGHASSEDFASIVCQVDLVYFDLKIMDPEDHEAFTGVRNDKILTNLRFMDNSRTDYVIRVPLIPGITDTCSNLEAVAECVAGLKHHPEVHLLPYNRAAGGKYEACGRVFDRRLRSPGPEYIGVKPFEVRGLRVVVP